MPQLSRMNANQVSEKWVNFLKECSSFGDDVVYEEKVTTGGTWNAVKDRMEGGASSTSSTTFTKGSLEAPVTFSEGGSKNSTGGTGFVLGHQLGDIVAGETLITRFKDAIPLTQTGVYLINGQRWRLKRLVDAYRVGKRTFWNLVQLVKA